MRWYLFTPLPLSSWFFIQVSASASTALVLAPQFSSSAATQLQASRGSQVVSGDGREDIGPAEDDGQQDQHNLQVVRKMQSIVHRKNIIIRRLRARLKTANRRLSQPKKPTKKDMVLVKQRSVMETSGGNSFEISKRGRMLEGRSGRLTLSATFAIGLRRSLSNIAAADFGLVTCSDISGQTVLRCEEKCSAGVTLIMQNFCNEIMVASTENHSQNCWSVACFAFRSDATNSRIWRRQKLHVLEVSAAYIKYPHKLDDDCNDFDAAVAQRRCV